MQPFEVTAMLLNQIIEASVLVDVHKYCDLRVTAGGVL